MPSYVALLVCTSGGGVEGCRERCTEEYDDGSG